MAIFKAKARDENGHLLPDKEEVGVPESDTIYERRAFTSFDYAERYFGDKGVKHGAVSAAQRSEYDKAGLVETDEERAARQELVAEDVIGEEESPWVLHKPGRIDRPRKGVAKDGWKELLPDDYTF